MLHNYIFFYNFPNILQSNTMFNSFIRWIFLKSYNAIAVIIIFIIGNVGNKVLY